MDSLRPVPAGPAPKKCFTHDRNHYIGKEEWLTPPDLVQLLGPFDLDPCAPVRRPWDTAAKHYRETIKKGRPMPPPWSGKQ